MKLMIREMTVDDVTRAAEIHVFGWRSALFGILSEDFFWQRSGIGAQLADFCEQQAVSRGYDKVFLWVLEPNLKARAFYEKLGYTWDGTRKNLPYIGADELRYGKLLKNSD